MKVSIILDKVHESKKGYAIRIAIRVGVSKTTISTGVFCKEENFIGEPFNVVKSDMEGYLNINYKVTELYTKVMNAARYVDSTMSDYTAMDIKDYAFPEEKKEKIKNKESFVQYFYDYIRGCKSKHTIDAFNLTLGRVKEFFGDNVKFNDITYKTLCEFDSWMDKRGYSNGTKCIMFSKIRAVYNKAIIDDVVPQSMYPFAKFKIKQSKKDREFLPIDCMRRLMELELPYKSEIDLARDMFMLSFYFCGINPVDLYNLKDIGNGYIKYVRTKTQHHELGNVIIKIQPEAQEIINKYKGSGGWLLEFPTRFSSYETFYHNHRVHYKTLGDKIGYPGMTLYFARYSWATYAFNYADANELIVGKALGHAPSTTAARFYIAFDWSKVDDANRRVIDFLKNKVDI